MKKVLVLAALLVIGLSTQAFAWNDFPGYRANEYLNATRDLAEQGDAQAQYELGEIYFLGDEAPLNYELAVYWFYKSAEQGNGYAQTYLGYMYLNGFGVDEDYKMAYAWTVLAVAQNVSSAQFNLAVMYDNGYFVQRDYEQAAYWYWQAAEQGMADAQLALAEMYAYGDGVAQDYVEAIKWYRLATVFSEDQDNAVFNKAIDGARAVVAKLSPAKAQSVVNKGLIRCNEWLREYEAANGPVSDLAAYYQS